MLEKFAFITLFNIFILNRDIDQHDFSKRLEIRFFGFRLEKSFLLISLTTVKNSHNVIIANLSWKQFCKLMNNNSHFCKTLLTSKCAKQT